MQSTVPLCVYRNMSVTSQFCHLIVDRSSKFHQILRLVSFPNSKCRRLLLLDCASSFLVVFSCFSWSRYGSCTYYLLIYFCSLLIFSLQRCLSHECPYQIISYILFYFHYMNFLIFSLLTALLLQSMFNPNEGNYNKPFLTTYLCQLYYY